MYLKNVTYAITYCHKDSEELVGEFELEDVDVEYLKKLFNEDELYAVYPINDSQRKALGKKFNLNLEKNKYEYFLEVYGNYGKINYKDCAVKKIA